MAKKIESLTDEELALFVNYLIEGGTETEEEQDQLEDIKKRSITVEDAGTLIKVSLGFAVQNMNATIGNVMEQVRIQGIVLEKLGANQKIFKDAKVKYNKFLAEAEAQLAPQHPEVKVEEQEETSKEEK